MHAVPGGKGIHRENFVRVHELIRQHLENIDQSELGNYISEEGTSEKEIRFMAGWRTYIGTLNFAGIGFVPALRRLLESSGFLLPGEAQKIDRIMDSFATCYHRLNPGTFEDKDKAFILAFSAVMLNSDHYNDAIKKSNKMKFDDFVRNHRGMGISEDLLASVWKDITGKEIQLASRVAIESNFRRQMLNSARRSLALLSGHASMCRIYASKMSTELATLMLEVGWPHFYACI